MRLAAIIYCNGQSEAADDLIGGLAETLKARGVRLAGAIQRNDPTESGARCGMDIEDLATGRRLTASLPLNIQPTGCRLDSVALEDAAGLVAASISPEVDLVIVNRFGKQEAQGHGFRAVIEQSVASDLPILTTLNTALRAEFRAFTGEDAEELALDGDDVRRWCEAALSWRASTRSA